MLRIPTRRVHILTAAGMVAFVSAAAPIGAEEKAFSTSPEPIWKKEIGMGSGSFAIDGERGYVMGHDGDNVVLTCFKIETGDTVWAESYFGPGKKANYPGGGTPFLGGPNATPAVVDGKVYTATRFGHIQCRNAADGELVWELKYDDVFPGYKLPAWGFAASVLVTGDSAIVEPGSPGSGSVCLDRKTGEVIWKSGDQNAGYATPVVGKFDGEETPTLVSFDREGLTGRNLESGEQLWDFPWETSYGVNATTPVLLGGGRIFISSGYGKGCAVVEIKEGEAREIWKNKALKVKHGNPVFYDGYLYGFDESELVCLDPETGEARWRQGGLGKGALIESGGMLIIQAESCELAFVKATPSGYEEISRTGKLFDRHSWTVPVLSGGKILTRNIAGSVVCLE